MSGDLEVVVDLGDGTKYAKHWNYAATSYTVKRSTAKGLHSATRHEARLVERIVALESLLSAREAALEKANAALRRATGDHGDKGEAFIEMLTDELDPDNDEEVNEETQRQIDAVRLAHATSAETARGEGGESNG